MRNKISYLIILFALFCFATVSCKSGAEKKAVKNIDTVSTAPVNASHSFWDHLPSPTGYTNDFEKIFTPSQKVMLDSTLSNYETKTGIQICIATIDTSATSTEKFDELALHMAREWGIGKKDNKGIMIAISSGYKRMKICNGLGIEKYINNDETAKIINEGFVPGFKEGNYYGGTINGLSMLIAELNKKIHIQ